MFFCCCSWNYHSAWCWWVGCPTCFHFCLLILRDQHCFTSLKKDHHWGSSRSAPGHHAGRFSRRWRALTEEVPRTCATATSSEVSCLGFGDKTRFQQPSRIQQLRFNNCWIGGMMKIFCLNSADVCLYFCCFLPALNEVLSVAGNWKRRVLAQWQRFYPVGSALDACWAQGVFFHLLQCSSMHHKVSSSISGICGPLWYTIHKTTTAWFCFICNNQSQAGYLWIAFCLLRLFFSS